MVRAALVGYGNDAGVRSVVIQIGTGVIGLKGVILGLVRQGSSILAVLFGYLDVVVTGYSELALGRDTGNRQLDRDAAGKGIRRCLESDCRSSLFSPLGVIGLANNRVIVIGKLGLFVEITAGIPASKCVACFGGYSESVIARRLVYKCTTVGNGNNIMFVIKTRFGNHFSVVRFNRRSESNFVDCLIYRFICNINHRIARTIEICNTIIITRLRNHFYVFDF